LEEGEQRPMQLQMCADETSDHSIIESARFFN